MAIRSASPACRIASACGPSRISPTAMVGMPAPRLMAAANGTWKPSERLIGSAVERPVRPPDELSITSMPSAFSSLANATVSGRSQPLYLRGRQLLGRHLAFAVRQLRRADDLPELPAGARRPEFAGLVERTRGR